MTTDRDELAIIIDNWGHDPQTIANEVLAAGFRRTKSVTTDEERARLANRSVVKSAAGTIANVVDGRAYFFGYGGNVPVGDLMLPLLVLWEPAA